MGLTGKYDFPGFKELGRDGGRALFLSTPWLSWVPGPIRDLFTRALAEWLANKGLVLVNGLAYEIGGSIDSNKLASALSGGITRVDAGVTPEEGEAIDNAVMEAADDAIPYGRKLST